MTNRRRLVIWADLLPACHTISALFLMRGVTMGMLSTLETLTMVAGRGTLWVCKGLICKGLSKRGVEMWPKNGCVSTLLLNCYLIINELRIHLWARPDWRLGC